MSYKIDIGYHLAPIFDGNETLVYAPECFFMESSKLNQFTADRLVLFPVLTNLPHVLYCIGMLLQILLDITDNFPVSIFSGKHNPHYMLQKYFFLEFP